MPFTELANEFTAHKLLCGTPRAAGCHSLPMQYFSTQAILSAALSDFSESKTILQSFRSQQPPVYPLPDVLAP